MRRYIALGLVGLGLILCTTGDAQHDLAPVAHAKVVAHELGSILGLNHETRHCQVLELDDIGSAVKRYGGQFRTPAGPYFCSLTQPLPAPTGLTAAVDRSGMVTLEWHNADRASLTGVFVARGTDTCPSSVVGSDFQDARAGADGSWTDHPSLGHYCYALWSRELLGQLSPQPAIVEIDVTPASKPGRRPPLAVEAALRGSRALGAVD
jgi:hypothetical protein